MSNLKLVAGTMKRRGIAIAAAVAVAGGSFATANYAMAVETNPSFDELNQEFSGTQAGNAAAKAADEFKKALGDGADSNKLHQILEKSLKDAGFTQQDFNEYGESNLKTELQDITNTAKQSFENKNRSEAGQPAAPLSPQAPTQNPADWATPAPQGAYSPQRLEAEFGQTTQGEVAARTAEKVADALRLGKPKQEIEKLVKDSFAEAGFNDADLDAEVEQFVQDAFARHNEAEAELEAKKSFALGDLKKLSQINPLQRQIFETQIKSATKQSEIVTIVAAAQAENANPVKQFAPVPGQQTPEHTGPTDVEKALEHTKKEALAKLEGFSFLSPQQKEAYKKQVEAATQVFEVEEAYEAGLAKDEVNKETKAAKNFVGKAVARTKHLALEKLDGFKHLTHEQKKEARTKILAAKQVFEVEAAFHAAENLNKAAK